MPKTKITVLVFLSAYILAMPRQSFSQNTPAITEEFVNKEVAKGRQYILGILSTGSNQINDSALIEKMQMQHLRLIFGLKEDGKLALAGPVLNGNSFRGIMIVNCKNRDQARELFKNDPYIQKGILKLELYDWFGIPGSKLPQ